MLNARACLLLIASYYNKEANGDSFGTMPELEEENAGWPAVSRAAERAGFRANFVKLTYRQLFRDVPLPCMIQWEGSTDFAVVFPPRKWRRGKKITCIHPPEGSVTNNKAEFVRRWTSSNKDGEGEKRGGVLILEPTFRFHAKIRGKENRLSWDLILPYFRHSHWQIAGVVMAFVIASLVQLIFPFLLQSVVDVGINTKDLHYITIILLAQLMLVFSRISVDLIRSRLLLQISILVNLSILSDFWIKLTRLPISYFDQQHTGGIIQRINDNRQIQSFLTGPAVNTFFSLLNFIVFAIVLLLLKAKLFLIFGIGVSLYFIWMRFFLRIRRKINYKIFHASSKENNATLQMVQGMQEIRLQNIEQPKRWEWESLQIAIFRLNFKNLTYGQLQQAGGILINQGKDIILTFTVANLVIQGELTFGAMLAVQYIIGQLTGPIEQFIGFVQSAQDAKISMERLNEIHQMEDEEKDPDTYVVQLPADRTIRFEDVSFAYPGPNNERVLNQIDLEIPEGKTTAIVGVSGSGKTTLLKLLLKFYETYEGRISVGDTSFKQVSPSFWRKQCGAVLQDGYIFNDTIAKNISLEYEQADEEKLLAACRMSNILSFIESLPDGFNTRLGADGTGISQGQKQRLLIARAVYKNPAYLFFDESTNALDSNNEKAIVENLQTFFKGRTVLVVAHRLSTVKNADKIVVLHHGRIIEQGDHHGLASLKGRYFELVRNQLELGS
ncbi:peptidase domain-containing ABC transporter [Flavitalea flava]